MDVKLNDSELKIMDVLWREGDQTAKYISDIMTENYGWKINTTYTLIKRCMEKGAIERQEPNFMCRALIQRDAVREREVGELLDKLFDGSEEILFSTLLGRKDLSDKQLDSLMDIIKRFGGGGKEDGQ